VTRRSVLWALALGLTGCEPECLGVGCEEVFSGALVGVILGKDQAKRGEHSPLKTSFSLEGRLSMGADWDLALTDSRLLTGSPADGAVRAYPLGTPGTLDEADGVISSEGLGDGFGTAIVVLPDFDGDGAPDLLVGAPTLTASQTSRHEGGVYLLSGLGDGVYGAHLAADARIRVAGEHTGSRLGERLSACGDVDGDGLGDFAAAAPWDNTGSELAGRVVLGLSSTLSDLPSQVLSGAIGPSWTGAHTGAKAGWSMACDSDIDGDGTPDLLIGAPFADTAEDDGAGAVYLVPGGAPAGSLPEIATRIVEGERTEDWLGWGIATGDLDGDGLPDVAVSSPGRAGGLGQIKVWTEGSFNDPAASPSYRITGELPADGFGRGLSMADLTGDGLDELLVGAPFVNPEQDDATYDAGMLYIFEGQADMGDWSKQMTGAEAKLRLIAPQQYLRTGGRIRTGDVDGDGKADLALLHRTDPS
jgi:hypothetical protein